MAEAGKTPLLLIGGGGHCRACIDVIEMTGEYEIVGIVEAENAQIEPFSAYPVVGYDKDLPKLLADTPHCLITIGQLKSASVRQRLFTELKRLGANLPAIVSPLAYVSPTAKLGEGTIVMHQALVNAYAQVGDNGIVNSQALIEHDAVIAHHCHISTGAKVNGGVEIGEGCFIGSGAILKQSVSLADRVVVGANATILKNIAQAGVYTGVIK
ncbi:MAG: acetyltransferase [Gammaproteobacteria bacterium]|nr:acetyltransferase [Gammaproteobacteria bacterium]